MYNRYIPDGSQYTKINQPDKDSPPPRSSSQSSPPKDSLTQLLSRLTGGKETTGVSSLLSRFHLDDLDTGDILLLLVLLLLFRDGDDLELVITLGLILLLGLGEKKEPEDHSSGS